MDKEHFKREVNSYFKSKKAKMKTKAIKYSGATSGAIISFKTNAAFERDTGIDNPDVLIYEPVRSVNKGPINIWDIKVVG